MEYCPRGSIWRKWDLHVHTPCSVLNNQFGSDWDEYVQKLFRTAIREKISAIGLTDYCLIDGYATVVNEYLSNEAKLLRLFSEEEIECIRKIAIFPNLEFRLDKVVIGKEGDLTWNRKTNFHVLLSNELTPDLIRTEFLAHIKFSIGAQPGRAGETRSLTTSNLEDYGRRLISEQPEFTGHSPLAVGICSATVDADQVAQVLKDSRFQGKFLFALPCDEDLSDVRWGSSGGGTRKILYQQSHLVFSSNSKTRDFLLGKLHPSPKAFRDEFGFPKACIWGSDAHQYEKLFRPDKNRFTWIKADLSFEGLKQVAYEPDSRVAIQEACPEDKLDYEVIESVRYIDTSGEDLFSNDPIELNPLLNSIIGGKSSGKSMLLYHIAKTANFEETAAKVQLSESSEYKSINSKVSFDFEVKWRDGTVQRLKEKSPGKPITYVPQLYINKLAEGTGRTQLNNLITDILCQDGALKRQLDEHSENLTLVNEKITSLVSKLVSMRDHYSKLKGERDATGNSTAITKEISRITDQIAELQKSAGFNEEEGKKYKSLVDASARVDKRRVALINLQDDLKDLLRRANHEIGNAITSIALDQASSDQISKPGSTRAAITKRISSRLSQVVAELNQEVHSRLSRIERLMLRLDAREQQYADSLEAFSSKIKGQAALSTLQERIKSESGKLKAVEEKNKQLTKVAEQGIQLRDQIGVLYKQLFEGYTKMKDLFNAAASIESKDIELVASVDFDHDRFNNFLACFDGRGSLSNILGNHIDNNNRYVFDRDTHLDAINDIANRLRDFSTISSKLRKGITEEVVLRNLLQDCFFISFNVMFKGDDIISMSPGKRGLVLLHLILHLSNSSHPILIDQPEDNLDNRTVYNELRDFIRERKNKRQILMVTHNANMVVSTDSECVVVANQAGQQHDMENERYKFEYISGPIECTYRMPSALSLLKKSGIREHICEILEGGQTAFEERERKYSFQTR